MWEGMRLPAAQAQKQVRLMCEMASARSRLLGFLGSLKRFRFLIGTAQYVGKVSRLSER